MKRGIYYLMYKPQPLYSYMVYEDQHHDGVISLVAAIEDCKAQYKTVQWWIASVTVDLKIIVPHPCNLKRFNVKATVIVNRIPWQPEPMQHSEFRNIREITIKNKFLVDAEVKSELLAINDSIELYIAWDKKQQEFIISKQKCWKDNELRDIRLPEWIEDGRCDMLDNKQACKDIENKVSVAGEQVNMWEID